jgi:hypothetical protein
MELVALDDGDHRGMRKVAASLIKEALKGNIAAVKEIADRIDGKVPLQQVITGDEEGGAVRFYAEVPRPAATTEEWLENIRREDAARALVTGVSVADDEQTH